MKTSLYLICLFGLWMSVAALSPPRSRTLNRSVYRNKVEFGDSNAQPNNGSTPPTPTNPPKPQSTNPPKPQSTNPPKPQSTNPPKPQSTNPPKPQSTNPPKPQSTNGTTQHSTSTIHTTSKPETTSHTTPPTSPTPPHCTPGQKQAVKGSCRNYIECDKGFNWVEKSCSTWCHNFNPNASKCDWSWKYNCTDPVTASPCTSSENPISSSTTVNTKTTAITTKSSTSTTESPTTKTTTPSPKCSEGKMKIYQKGDCKDYLQCVSGKWVKKSCSLAYDFDINKLECVFSWWAKC